MMVAERIVAFIKITRTGVRIVPFGPMMGALKVAVRIN